MITMQESLARERIRTAEHDARQARIAGHLAASRRWRRLERLAHRAQVRHEQRLRSMESDMESGTE
jgi:hypothetical protein